MTNLGHVLMTAIEREMEDLNYFYGFDFDGQQHLPEALTPEELAEYTGISIEQQQADERRYNFLCALRYNEDLPVYDEGPEEPDDGECYERFLKKQEEQRQWDLDHPTIYDITW